MATAYTSLLGFALPVTGELNGTWGDVVNNSITALVETSIAGSATASVTSADWTPTTTGSGAANQARAAILIPTGTPGVSRNIIVPSSSKAYIVDNQSNAAVVVKGSATTGVSIASNTACLVAWDGADFVLVSQDLSNATGTLAVNKGGTGLTSTPTNGQIDIGNGTGFTRAALTAGTGVSVTNGAGSVTIANTGVTSVTGTAPVVSSGGTTPAISMAAATTSVNGYLTSTDWNTFNNKTSNVGTVTSVSGTGTVNGLTLTGTVTTSGSLTLGGTLSNVNLTTQVTGTLPVANGGTGATTLTGLVVGNGTSAFTTVAAPAGAIVGTTDTQTLTNKRINPRVVAASGTSGSLTIDGDTTDVYKAEGLSGAITLLQPSGTPVDGQKLMIRLKDNGTGRGITWTTSAGAFRAVGITLPATTIASKVTYVGCAYNSTDGFWDAVATVTQV